MEVTYQLNNLQNVAKQLISCFKSKTILFYGNMGVGKTTLIKALVKELGSDDAVSSPTFSIVNEYELKNDTIFHFDLYRIKNLEEAYNFGIEDYLDAGHWVFIEWPEKIEPILNNDFIGVHLKLDSENNRILHVSNQII